MNLKVLKTSFCLVVMIAFLMMSFVTKDVFINQLFIALVIITGAIIYKYVSPKIKKNE